MAEGLRTIQAQRAKAASGDDIQKKVDTLIGEVYQAFNDPTVDIDSFFLQEMLPKLGEMFGITTEDLAPLGKILDGKGVPSNTMPSSWTPDQRKIVLDVLKTFVEDFAFKSSGESVPERVLRELDDIFADIEKRVNHYYDPAKNPQMPYETIPDIMQGIYSALLNMGVP